ncbi:uncharacterized protein PFL1_03553 [Pseudozyma flocculosa PF-1]|nr:uncharacterized protein PFL1_03553 [Pseudozyma flocculosa PF-1]EPQ28750.1 hypothetical protein PFL1_03553 [Pseudozyma flocculosa PF-1]
MATPSSFRVEIRPRQDTSKYPPVLEVVDQAHVPKEWLDALKTAVSAGKIPDIPASVLDKATGVNTYPNGVGTDPKTCSWTINQCYGKNELHEAPDGKIAVNFDDGPTTNSDSLYDFLGQNSQSATHFMIGSNVVQNAAQFKKAVDLGNQHFAVHTWSHNLMTTLTNEQIVGELGWTMQAIADQSGGYIPRYWRPPQGDIDNRVRAIAEEVFGLTSVIWNKDTDDWCLDDQGGSSCSDEQPDKIKGSVKPWITGPKSPGLIILEHELTHASIDIFKGYYPDLKGLGWDAMNIAQLSGAEWYKNAADSKAKPDDRKLLGAYQSAAPAAASSTSSAAPAAKTSSGASGQAASSSGAASAAKSGSTQPATKSNQTSGAASSTTGLGMVSLAAVVGGLAYLL